MIEWHADDVVFVRSFLAVTVGILVLFAGKGLNQRVRRLREFNIPEPVTGGLLFAIAFWALFLATGYRVTFDLSARDVLLVYFFTTVGINARLDVLKTGGRPLAVLVTAVVVFLVLQDTLGIALARAIGQPASVGLLAGSVSLLGGHGTAIAWAPVVAARGEIANALEIGTLCATAGLVLASLVGGPVARLLITRHRLEGVMGDAPEVGVDYRKSQAPIDYFSFLRALLAIHLCGVVGIPVQQGLTRAGIHLPLFLPCMMTGIVLTNLLPRVVPRLEWPGRSPALALISEISLGVFLAMSLMSMQLWSLAALAGPLAVLLAAQVTLIVLFTVLVLFRALGRTYDAAVMCAGFVGFGLGATPTAMANMTAITQRHGASHMAFLVIPLVGAFFIDLLNALAIRLFVAIL
jgi:ESS family glutamate:Na+ symporter